MKRVSGYKTVSYRKKTFIDNRIFLEDFSGWDHQTIRNDEIQVIAGKVSEQKENLSEM